MKWHANEHLKKLVPTYLYDRKIVFFFAFNSYKISLICVFDYCSGVWVYTKSYTIESVQLRALRYFLEVHGFTPSLHVPIQGDSGWLPSFYRHQLNMLRSWNRLVTCTMSDDKLTKLLLGWGDLTIDSVLNVLQKPKNFDF